ncbi:MAG: DUF937 domain-containing protein [Leptolyngbyaceae cyanobacterium RU_5_1]|nr:DUF937 domain-containing protein [Leptolyngbyaceae cyanobacterium RU_5_1]
MGLFFDVLSAINNPDQQGSVAQLESVTNSIQQLATEHGIQPSQLQMVMSALGGALRPALQQQQSTVGGNPLGNLMGQVAGAGMGSSMLQSLLSPELQQQISQTIAQRIGISPDVIQSVLPTLIPAVISLLNMGASQSGVQGSNPLLSAFLDGDRDGDTDLGDVFKFANRFLNPSAV